jgi:GNAT superfamily N-acetyltransferase
MKLIEAEEGQQLERDAVTWHAWGAGLSVEQFAERERRLREHPWARRAMTSYWWVDAQGAPLASCELFVDAADAGSRRGVACTIASVFTEERLRGRGHAGAMLTAVVDEFSRRSDALAATLFSEIGVGLYQRLGFYAVPSFDTFFTPLAELPRGVKTHASRLPLPAAGGGADGALRLELTEARLDWHLERERIYGEALSRPRLPFHAVTVEDASITFTAYWKTNELQVLSLDARTLAHAGLLLDAARHAAHLGGLPVVRAWETSPLPSQLPGAQRRPRTDEIPMFRPLAPAIEAWTRVERGLWA